MSFEIHTALPNCVISQLEELKAVVRRESKILIIELTTEESERYFSVFLASEAEIDPVVNVAFGPPLAPYATPLAQMEVWQVVHSFQPLLRDDILHGNYTWIPLAAPPMFGIQFHHAQIALQKVQEEIEHPAHFAPNVPHLMALEDGRPICVFTIVYSNCVVSRRLHRRV